MRNLLLSIILLVVLFSCEKGNLAPVATLEVFPAIGDTSIIFEFSARKSIDDRNYPIGLKYRWDFDGDGSWDTGYESNNTFSHRFKQPGVYDATVEVIDLDGLTSTGIASTEVFGENLEVETLQDPRDGKSYRIVRIREQWWMAENLRFGAQIPTNQEQKDNDTVEQYRFRESKEHDTVGGVYRWLEAMNYNMQSQQGICPDGWHLPTDSDWKGLFKEYPITYSWIYYGNGGLSKLNLDLNTGGWRREDSDFWKSSPIYGFWSSSFMISETRCFPFLNQFNSHLKRFVLNFYEFSGPESSSKNTIYLSVRCVKNKE